MKTMTKFANKLLLLSAVLLLLCGSVVGEREGSRQRRRASIIHSETETVAPVVIRKSILGKGKGSDKSLGKGLKSDNSDEELGKGLKSEKSKSEKKFAKDFNISSGLSTKKDKDFKFMKSSKSKDKSKGDKSLKSSKSKSGKSDPGTPPPTSADPISSKSSKFAITYSPIDDVPTSEDLAELTMMTHKYLEDFMMEFFDKTALTDLDNFLTIMVRDIFVEGEPVLAEYQSNGLFNPDSIFIPVTRELDNLIEDAITQDEYLEMVNALPRSNPFRGTEKITFNVGDAQTTDGDSTDGNSGESSSSFVRAGVAAAAAGIVVLAAGLAMLKSRRPSVDDENDDMQSFSPKSASEDVTFAGETSNTTEEDASGHFAHWRTAKSYNDGTEGGEFQDEPL